MADIHSIPCDLQVPALEAGAPAAGRRVRQTDPAYQGTEVYHVLYLPEDWTPGRRFPVIVEYAGNGPYRDELGDTNSGLVEDICLGYGLTAGRGAIWLGLPFIAADGKRNQTQWWGEVEATADYCRRTVRAVCEVYGGAPEAVFLAGFSRGAIACNYIGLRDDATARLWAGFIAHSHYDGVREWGYPASDRASARIRLERLNGRPQFISHEMSTAAVRQYLAETGIAAPFTLVDLPYRNHTAGWVLRDLPERAQLRQWFVRALALQRA